MHDIFLHNCYYSILVIKYMYVMLENKIKKILYVTNARNSLETRIFVQYSCNGCWGKF